jgi:hypothetical protein
MTTALANQAQVRPSPAEKGYTSVLERFARQMAIPTLTRLQSPSRLRWWEWGKIVGLIGLVALAVLFVTGGTPHPAVVAVLLHIALDLTLQSTETCLRKGDRGRHLLVHALVSGGLPLAIAGLVAGNPVAALTWAVAGALSHYAVDWTRKFGLRHRALGCTLDQACHLLTILVLALTD